MNTKLRRILGTPPDKVAPEDVTYLMQIAKYADQVREHQIEFFSTRSNHALNNARNHEKVLDGFLDQSDQLGLFGGGY